MAIWYQNFQLKDLMDVARDTMVEHLGIEFVDSGEDYLMAKMPVDSRTHQPAGLLHGGATAALAETVGSVAAYLCVNPQKFDCVGLEINLNHLKAVRSGFVVATGTPLHIGKRTQVWQIHIKNEKNKLVAIGRITLAVIPKIDKNL
ncbi:MAG: hotdog fold thioesterase [Caldithrix sp.]|nr:hotdog fold thioesterase [Caldithrix sp.]